ncbi:hypothetical protein HY502_00905 [Candidatus Woesebacteria bacterium]|nr:hypothetical protein [Candidatus Woesebacteria bacterium]
MIPAQRRKKLAAFKKGRDEKGFLWSKIVSVILFFLFTFVYILATSNFFGKGGILTVVVNRRDSLLISTFDKESGLITNLVVPGETQLNVSRQLGTWKAGSLWKLGENEKLSGVLLTETIIKNFKIPVVAWADEPFSKISEGEVMSMPKAIFGYKTNLGVGDRIRLAFFSLGVPPIKRVSINLSEGSSLKKTKLIGGEEGYLVSDNLPESLNSIFSDTKINSLKPRILIEDYQVKSGSVDILVLTLEVMGGKVTSIAKKEAKEFYCEVSGVHKYTVKKVAQVFGCAKGAEAQISNFDLTLKVGSDFGERF